MRIVRFRRKNKTEAPRIGSIFAHNIILDFQEALKASGSPAEMSAWFDLDGPWLSTIGSIEDKIGDDYKRSITGEALLNQDAVELLPPVSRPGKIICVGLNYRDHAAESNMQIPNEPVIFSKFTTAVLGPHQPVHLPPTSSQVDYEAELAVVIGRKGKRVNIDRAMDHVLGYACFNDISARDLQFADGQWQRGKSCDTFAPIGPFIATVDEISNPHNLAIKLRLNGHTMQDSNTCQMIFGIPELIAFISETITLEPGDVIATGTPPGVGFARKPPVFLKEGDNMEVEITGLGVLVNNILGIG